MKIMKSVLLAFQNDKASAVIKNAVSLGGYRICAEARSGAEVLRICERMGEDFPILVCGFRLSDMTAGELYELLPYKESAVVLLSPAQSALRFDFPPGLLALNLPVPRSDLIHTLADIEAIMAQKPPKKERVHRSDDDKKLIDEAKALLMERHMMTEVQAHRYLQRQSMNSGRKMAETAVLILASGS